MSENENSMNSSVDLDESNDELASLITRAQSFKGGKHEKEPAVKIGADATRKLLERQRDALRLDNQQLTRELQEAQQTQQSLQIQVETLQNRPPPPGRVFPMLFSLVLGVVGGYFLFKHLENNNK